MSQPLKSTSEIEAKAVSEIKDLKAREEIKDLCQSVREANAEIDAYQAIKRKSLDRLMEISKKLKLRKVDGPDWTLLRVSTTNSKLSKEKLLKNGVSMEVIDASTEKSVSESIQVRARVVKE